MNLEPVQTGNQGSANLTKAMRMYKAIDKDDNEYPSVGELAAVRFLINHMPVPRDGLILD